MIRWLALALPLILAFPALALELRSDGTVTIPQGQVINDDLVVSGGTIMMQGEVTGDLVVAGGTVDVSGPVRGDLIAAGGTIRVMQPVGGSMYVAGGTVTISSTIGRNALVAGGTTQFAQASRVARDLVVSGGTVTVAGAVTRDVKAYGGNVTVADTATIGRNLLVRAGTPNVAAGATVGGQRIVQRTQEREHGRRGWFGAMLVWRILMGIALFIAGLLFTLIAPVLTEQTVGMTRAHPWASLLTGLIILIVVPIAVFILLLTVIGIPLALILLGLYWFASFIAPIFLAIYLGRLILRRHREGFILPLLVGVAIYTLVRLIPFLGGLVNFVVLLFGLGALFLAIQARTARPMFPPRTEEG